MSVLTPADAAALSACLREGGVAVFPADTVYGLACDPEDAAAVRRVYELKGRPPAQPAAVLFFDPDAARRALPDLGPRTARALDALLPGGVTLLLPNPARRFPLACAEDPETLGLRVPRLDAPIAALGAVAEPVLQTSANRTGEADPRRLADVPPALRDGADLVLDGGDRPGTPSTVLDLRRYEADGTWEVVRQGALPAAEIAAALG